MLYDATCKKCGGVTAYDIGDHSVDEIMESLAKQDTFSCNAGNHEELSSPARYLTFDLASGREGSIPTEEEFVAGLKENYGHVHKYDDMEGDNDIVSFAFGMCVSTDKNVWDFKSSPKGCRYYYRN